MENFILWGAAFDPGKKQLSFFSSPVHIQQINQGTKAMVKEMLKDLGLSDPLFDDWKVRHFITNYFTDDFESEEWQDIWSSMWEIKLKIRNYTDPNIETNTLIRSWAIDKTWKGKTPIFPCECIIIVDFKDKKSLLRAKPLLEHLSAQLSNNDKKEHDYDIPVNVKKSFDEIHKLYHYPNNLSVTRGSGQINQLIVSLGMFDKTFFAEGAELAQLVINFCHNLGGTTTWNEKT